MRKKLPKIDSIWSDGAGKKFIVTEVKEDDNGTWIYYTSNDKIYNTLVDAFLSRFMEIPK